MNLFWLTVLEQGLIFAIMALGLYITYQLLDFPDLTTDGSFVLGAAITVNLIVNEVNPFIACFIALIGGMLAGMMTGILNVYFEIKNLLAGILMMTALYTINLKIMGKANVSLSGLTTIFTGIQYKLVIILPIVIIVGLLLYLFLKTRLGYVLKATGDNSQMVTSLGVDNGKIKIIGIALANGLIALSGSMLAQSQNFADITMGTGIIVIGLASIIIGTSLRKKIADSTVLFVVIGAICYQIIVALALKFGFAATDLKLASALITASILIVNNKLGGKSHA